MMPPPDAALIEDEAPMTPEVVRYRYADVRCPACHQWRAELVIWPDGALRCDPCPAVGRGRRSRARTAD